jgi:drug/metabolite transporter (DMT)-like permease
MTEANKNIPKKCGLLELLVFIAAIICGTACSILSKTMMQLQGEGITGETEVFQKPIFQTIGMFFGMCLGLPMHWLCIHFRVPFPGYEAFAKKKINETRMQNDENTSLHHGKNDAAESINNGISARNYGSMEVSSLIDNTDLDDAVPDAAAVSGRSTFSSTTITTTNTTKPALNDAPKLPLWMYFFLAIPSIFDLAATALCMIGLQYIDASIYQLLRGSGIIFVALMKQYVLKNQLYYFQWVGVGWNVVSVVLVGSTAILNEKSSGLDDAEKKANALLGVTLVMLGALVQAMQFVFEEKVMTMDIPSPPLLLIGMEGLWGTLLCLIVVYPLVYLLPGSDHGSYENPFNTYAMFVNSPNIQFAFLIYFFAIFGYNLFAVMVTFRLNSVWHAILDNFRPSKYNSCHMWLKTLHKSFALTVFVLLQSLCG